jgi:hypothetical protein
VAVAQTIARFYGEAAARERFGDRVDELKASLLRVDPLADAVIEGFARQAPGEGWSQLARALAHGIDAVPGAPPALRALFDELDRVPVWVDGDAMLRGGRLFLRSGAVGGVILGAESLIFGYASPGGNKPLVLSGRLRQQAARRLGETARFVHAVSRPGGLERFGEGFAIAVKVRLMHAQVRRLARESGRFRVDLWGEPINQHDMAATGLLFSLVVLDGFQKLGFRYEPDEGEALIHLWAYVSHVMGVEPRLLCRTVAEATRFADMVAATQGPPDDDSRALVKALLESNIHAARTDEGRARALKMLPVSYGLCRGLLGDELADSLAIPKNRYRFVVPAARAVISAGKRVFDRVPFGERLSLALGNRYWDDAVARGLRGVPAGFEPPAAIA